MTQDTYYPQRREANLHYLSMEFLIGRSYANNVTNLLLSLVVNEVIRQQNLRWIELLEQEPDAALGNGGLGRLAACFLESMATMHLPAMGYGLRYEYGMFKQTIEDGWQRERPDNWLRRRGSPGRSRVRMKVEVRVELLVRGARRGFAGCPRAPIEPHLNTLRPAGCGLWRREHQYRSGCGQAAERSTTSISQAFSHGDFVAAVAETLEGRIHHTSALSG